MHRFAAAPLLGSPDAPVRPLAVWIEGDPERATATKAALASGTVAPAAIVEGSLPDALAQTRAGHVMLVQAGDQPAAIAVERLGQAIALAPDAAVITCDDDRLSAEGAARYSALRARAVARPLAGVRRQRPAARGRSANARRAMLATLCRRPAWRHELALTLAGPAGERHAHVPLLLCHRAPAPPTEQLATDAAAAGSLAGWEPGARVEQAQGPRRVRRPPGTRAKRRGDRLLAGSARAAVAVRGSVLAGTDYERLSAGTGRQRVAEPPRRRRCSSGSRAIAASGCSATTGRSTSPRSTTPRPGRRDADVLVFLNNDTEVRRPRLDRRRCSRRRCGRRSARWRPLLLYPDGAVQHAGAALGLHGYAGHPFAGLTPDRPTRRSGTPTREPATGWP